MITGYATPNGTSDFLKRFDIPFRKCPMFTTSAIAIGTHLGDMNEKDSELYQEGMQYGFQHGINFIDTAINYRGMRSERDVGHVLKMLIEEKEILKRDEIVISTKAGIIPGDIIKNLVPENYLQKILLKNNIINETDLNIVENHRHVLAPSYYKFAIEESKNHLNLETIDIYYLHNPEISMMVLGSETFHQKLEELFSFFEEQVQLNNIKNYGIATWSGLLNNPEEAGYISIDDVIKVAKKVAGEKHHFKFIQFPLNRDMDMGLNKKNQRVNNNWLSVLEAAEKLEIFSTTSAPFNLGKEIEGGYKPKGMLIDIIQNEGILSTMVGMKKVEHIMGNIDIIRNAGL